MSINLNSVHLIKDLTTGELFVIVEYCRFGNLLSYLTAHRHNFVNQVDGLGNLLIDNLEEIYRDDAESIGASALNIE